MADRRERAGLWQRTETLTGLSLAGAILLALSPLFPQSTTQALGLPLNDLMAMILAPAAIAVVAFVNAARQRWLARRHRGSDT